MSPPPSGSSSGSSSGSPPGGPPPPPTLTHSEVSRELNDLGWAVTGAAPAGAGHWSVCFRFEAEARPLVVRFGHHRDDFDRDRFAFRFASDHLPIPEVLEIGRTFTDRNLGGDEPGCFYAISELVAGTPLELTTGAQWQAIIPSLADALEAMRTYPLEESDGWGAWVDEKPGRITGSHSNWRDYLLASITYSTAVHARIPGWEAKLATNTKGAADFAWGTSLLTELTGDDDLMTSAERGVTHQDMMNKNVHVVGPKLTGLFDWGCATYSDHLYELAMFEFWNPWFPKIDVAALRAALEQRWGEAGYRPRRMEDRLRICHLHNGLVHLAYVAHLENWENLAEIGDRTRQLVA